MVTDYLNCTQRLSFLLLHKIAKRVVVSMKNLAFIADFFTRVYERLNSKQSILDKRSKLK